MDVCHARLGHLRYVTSPGFGPYALEIKMKLYKFNFFCNYQLHSGQQWATSSFDVKREILAQNASATGIDVWVI